jgi:DNA repair exonuclease SbcCD ATPase subunit
MSGEKRRYVRVEDRELRRLREQDSRLRSVQRDLPERLNAIREEARRELQQRLETFEQRAQRQQQEAQKLKSILAIIELETHLKLQQQRKELQKTIREQQQTFQSEVQRLEDAMSQGFEQQQSLILQITSEQRQEYLALNESLDQKFTQLIGEERQAREQLQRQIEREKQDKTKQAQNWLDDAETIWEQINRDCPHQRFAPGELDKLKYELQLAHINLRNGLAEAAIGKTQETYLKLSELRSQLQQKQQQWELAYSKALEDLKSLIAQVQANRKYEMEVGQGDESDKFLLEVDFWTNGSLSQYEQELQQIETRLQEGESSLTTEQISQIAEQIAELQPRLGDIVQKAQEEILSSQMRVEIADKVAKALKHMGYILIDPERDSLYEGEDYRNSYVLKLQNGVGGEVVTVISPTQEFGKNQVCVNSFGTILRDPVAQRQNADAINKRLADEKILKVEENEESNKDPNWIYQNMEEVRKRQVTRTEQE